MRFPFWLWTTGMQLLKIRKEAMRPIRDWKKASRQAIDCIGLTRGIFAIIKIEGIAASRGICGLEIYVRSRGIIIAHVGLCFDWLRVSRNLLMTKHGPHVFVLKPVCSIHPNPTIPKFSGLQIRSRLVMCNDGIYVAHFIAIEVTSDSKRTVNLFA